MPTSEDFPSIKYMCILFGKNLYSCTNKNGNTNPNKTKYVYTHTVFHHYRQTSFKKLRFL